MSTVNGGIVSIESGGNITGDISASNGFITAISAGGAIFGPVTSNNITAGTGIGSIDAVIGINSVIDANGPISRVMVSGTGNLRGSISASSITSGNVNDGIIVTNGRLFADITTTGNVSRQISVRGTGDPLGTLEGAIDIGGVLTAGTTITIERSLVGTISFPANGLQGQIIVNGDNVGGTWSGSVVVGAIQLDPGQSLDANKAPYYTRLASTLGGGSVGLAPFHLHGSNCTPSHDPDGAGIGIDADVINADTDAHVFCTFYGPIARATPGNTWKQHFNIWCRPLGSTSCTWFQVNDAFAVSGPGEGTWGEPRALGLARASSDIFIAPGIYRVEPVAADSVRCAGVTSSPAVVWPEITCDDSGIGLGYVFKVTGEGADCHLADFNHSGGVTVQDIFDFLAAYFASDPSADVNNSGSVSVQDIFDFLAAYFGCGPT